jgi:hypothetical protein
MLRSLACPTCGAPGLAAHQPDGVVTCTSCGNRFAEDNRVACPQCEAIHAKEASFCGECGAKLRRACPACGADNWAGADHCAACGRNLDAIAALAERHAQGFKGTLQRQRDLADLIKAEEEESSQRRLGEMWQVEKRRQDLLTQQQAEQRRQQNALLAIALVGAGLFALAIGAFAVLVLMR